MTKRKRRNCENQWVAKREDKMLGGNWQVEGTVRDENGIRREKEGRDVGGKGGGRENVVSRSSQKESTRGKENGRKNGEE